MKGLFIALSVIAVIFAGCGNNNSGNAPKDNAPVSKGASAVEIPTPKQWNTAELDPMNNGNFKYAAELVRQENDSAVFVSSAVDVNPVDVMRRPWDYYGKVIRFGGAVADARDYPPDYVLSKALGGGACEIVVVTDEAVIVDGILRGTTKGLYDGDYAEFVGYPCGVMEVANTAGGKFSHLVVVGMK